MWRWRVASKPTSVRCVCGEALVTVEYDGSRGIADLKNNVVHAPLTVTCLNGHRQELWMTQSDARPYFEQMITVGR